MTSPIDLSQFDGATPGQWIETGGSYKKWNPPNIAWDLQQAFAPALVAEVKALRAFATRIANLTPATRDFNPGIGAGTLNQLIDEAKSLIPREPIVMQGMQIHCGETEL